MNGLIFFSSDDFFIDKGAKGPVLCTNVKGFSLVFFYSTACTHCQSFIPIFKRLPGTIGGCQFGMINVSKNKDVIRLSRDTIAPINYVPYICLYVNGRPFIRYDGPHDEGELRKFIIEVANKMQSKEKFAHNNVKEPEKGNGIPAYTIGQPNKLDNVCYLEFEEAYPK